MSEGSSFAEGDLTELAVNSAREAEGLGSAQRSDINRAAVEVMLLEKHGKLLPKGTSDADLQRMLQAATESAGESDKLIRSLPAADDLSFDGARLRGGNFGYTDHIIGAGGLPIGMDRQLPALLVPLPPESAESLTKAAERFHSSKEAALTCARTDRLNMVKVSGTLVADGIMLRPYAGRFDDWYYRLVQEGTPGTTLQFYAILDGLPERTYHPVVGLGSPETVPPVWFNLSNIFSEGAHEAIRQYRISQGGIGRNPFRAFAWRMIPQVPGILSKARFGEELSFPSEVIAHAMKNRQRFSPAPVAPLFRDPSRFLGYVQNEWIPVANVPQSRSEIETTLALPEKTAEPATNEVLKSSDALPFWEDPGQAAQPAQPSIPASPAEANSPSASAQTPPAQAAEPPVARATLARFQVAVITPTVDEAEAYVQQMVASEERIASNGKQLSRTRLFLRAFNAIREKLSESLPQSPVIQQLSAQIEQLKETQGDLEQIRLKALESRAKLRSDMERELREERMKQLQELCGREIAL